MSFPDIREIEAQAADWVVRLDSDTSTAETRAAFAEWRKRSALHGEAYDRLRGLWDTLDADGELAGRATGDVAADLARAGPWTRPPGRTRWWAVAASVALLGVTVAILFHQQGP
ncbi:FecR/PupR family sigma factor regulator [Kineobactrum salinum]|uniref:DUF4880 domain-containing protein n=1 Tax=Kineobactrum salinum TaxID=2708301 RepID=A0A6C0U4C0_9GAMM|nr:DUF4880 domain-containing protein [Kineobactrum salinum]QIB64294.1 DUF4880 domain-containing protein [Kineobactrum salinum]